jgi:transcriptional regulator GlxA family with amidase domain
LLPWTLKGRMPSRLFLESHINASAWQVADIGEIDERRMVKSSQVGTVTRRIVLVAAPGSQILDVVGPFQIFTRAAELHASRYPQARHIYSIEIVTILRRPSVATNCGVHITAHRPYWQVRGAIDTLLITGGMAVEADQTGIGVVQWIRKRSQSVRRLGSVCTGAMLLARTGLLNGRKVTTHWKWCDILAKRYVHLQVDPDPIFIRDGNIYTSAGVTAGMDLALALVEEDHGPRLALEVARDLVLYVRRAGGQSQLSAALAMQLADRKPLRELEWWILENLKKPLNVGVLAERVAMSPRNFSRVFAKQMNITPAKFIERLRVEAAKRRLEESYSSLERVAADCGFPSAESMRKVFQRTLGTTPGKYRKRFER